MAPSVVLLYDADCGICTFFAHLVRVLDFGRRIELVPLSASRADRWFAEVPEEQRYGSFHVAWPSDGRVSRGAALVAVVATLALGARFDHRFLGVPWAVGAADRLYGVMLRYRAFLAGGTTSIETTSTT